MRTACPGMMKVRPTYRFLTKASRYGRPSTWASCAALGRLDSGIGMTTSISFGGTVDTTRLASVVPRFSRAW